MNFFLALLERKKYITKQIRNQSNLLVDDDRGIIDCIFGINFVNNEDQKLVDFEY